MPAGPAPAINRSTSEWASMSAFITSPKLGRFLEILRVLDQRVPVRHSGDIVRNAAGVIGVVCPYSIAPFLRQIRGRCAVVAEQVAHDTFGIVHHSHYTVVAIHARIEKAFDVAVGLVHGRR